VRVNGKIVTQPGTKVNPATDKVLVDDHPIAIKASAIAKKIYLVLNKPMGYLSTVSDPQGRPTIMDLVDTDERLFPVGRLDADTKGLLILTNDGAFANALMHPRYGVEKEYVALLDGFMRLKKLDDLRQGVQIPVENSQTGEVEMHRTRPARIEFIRHDGSNTLVKFILKEGKKRQVRLMAEAIGHPVLELTRVRYGSLKLSELASGKTRKLTQEEIKTLLREAESARKEGEAVPRTPRPTAPSAIRKVGPEADSRFRTTRPTTPARPGAPSRTAATGRPARPGTAATPGKSRSPRGSTPPPKGARLVQPPDAPGRPNKRGGGPTERKKSIKRDTRE
jgi:pseudouridine synthase